MVVVVGATVDDTILVVVLIASVVELYDSDVVGLCVVVLVGLGDVVFTCAVVFLFSVVEVIGAVVDETILVVVFIASVVVLEGIYVVGLWVVVFDGEGDVVFI